MREVARMTSMDPWFLYQIKEDHRRDSEARRTYSLDTMPADMLRKAKRMGISDERSPKSGALDGADGADAVRELRRRWRYAGLQDGGYLRGRV